MIVKVCGLTALSDVTAIEQIQGVTHTGFIMVEKSPRFIADSTGIPPKSTQVQRVGVFMDPKFEDVAKAISDFELDIIQLHGDESPKECSEFAQLAPVYKAIGVHDLEDIAKCRQYEDVCALLILDAKSILGGGAGIKFNWDLLKSYDAKIPFLLSGGICPEDCTFLRSLPHAQCIGYDLNSRFELAPGLKNIQSIEQFLDGLTP
jgi:phosphoribosylanthranilate isomerase